MHFKRAFGIIGLVPLVGPFRTGCLAAGAAVLRRRIRAFIIFALILRVSDVGVFRVIAGIKMPRENGREVIRIHQFLAVRAEKNRAGDFTVAERAIEKHDAFHRSIGPDRANAAPGQKRGMEGMGPSASWCPYHNVNDELLTLTAGEPLSVPTAVISFFPRRRSANGREDGS